MAVDKKISQLASGAPAQAGDEYVVARSGANYKLTLTNIAASMPPIGATTPNTGSFTSLTNSGNLTFSSTAQRITGDMSNATHANRLSFQSSTTNGATTPFLLPNGTSQISGIVAANASDPTNCSFGQLRVNGTSSVDIISSILGTGTYLPMTFATGGSERMRLDTSGNLGIGTTPSAADTFPFLQLGGTAGIVGAVVNYNLLSNAYYGSGGWKYVGTGNAVRYGGDTSGNHIFYGAASGTAGNAVTWLERMRIDSSGNVGIGTASPASGVRLDVQDANAISRLTSTTGTNAVRFQLVNTGGTSTLGRESSGGGTILSGADGYSTVLNSTGAYPVIFGVNGSERMRIDSSGNVGIGTASPGTRLTVSSATNAGISVTDGTVTTIMYNSTGGVASIGTTSNHGVNLLTNNATRVTVTNGGNVGIGVTPGSDQRLNVRGSDSTSSNTALVVSNSSATNMFYVRNDNYLNSAAVNNYSVAGTTVVIDGSNFLGKTTSSLRYKKDIVNYDKGLLAISKLRPVYYKSAVEGPNGVDPKQHAGLIAEEIEAEGFEEFLIRDNDGRAESIQYPNMVALLVKAIQELSAKVAALEAK